MIAEEITRKHGSQVRPILTSGSMRHHRFGMRQTMWLVSSEIKQLEGCQNGWKNPKEDQIELINPNLQNIKNDGHGYDLPPAHVIFQE